MGPSSEARDLERVTPCRTINMIQISFISLSTEKGRLPARRSRKLPFRYKHMAEGVAMDARCSTLNGRGYCKTIGTSILVYQSILGHGCCSVRVQGLVGSVNGRIHHDRSQTRSWVPSTSLTCVEDPLMRRSKRFFYGIVL